MRANKLTNTFGKRSHPHTVIIARGEEVRHFTVGRAALAACSAFAGLVIAGAIALPLSYILEDDGGSRAAERQWQEQRQYEERILALRTQLDRMTSRQFLAQKMVETKVDVLLEQQDELASRYDRLQPLMSRAKATGLIPTSVPIPTPKPVAANASSLDRDLSTGSISPDASSGSAPSDTLSTDSITEEADPRLDLGRLRAGIAEQEDQKTSRVAKNAPAISEEAIREIGKALSLAELQQIEHLETLATKARERAVKIASTLKAGGIALPEQSEPERATGGPFEPVAEPDPFEDSYTDLETALDDLQRVSAVAEDMPLAMPMSRNAISSTFGIRSDPFLKRRALHAGIDFAVPMGHRIGAAAPGTVVHAGRSGGYGNMVEIDHGNGITTRYGHMSRINVKKGQVVSRGETIGAVGSTGRSTGPHLHYEIRRDGRAVDPARFFRMGEQIRELG
ncbi:M23 family metallopeptidase [Jiella marina]|uniref:M23 family metallopeptidase n=1 Tax=Jiella sp. LLJ827 TaxID=2917712 RepID=UPI002100A37A|nr:M23 family metallopeptidase [Jiella sp. LLJ827]MCQ0986184.1 M23 family metallopeptidase [Jiella sp. LLJ827]